MSTRRALAPLLLIVLVASLLVGATTGAAATTVHPTDEQTLLDLVNDERTDRGLTALVADAELTDVARQHSGRMAEDAEAGGRCGDGSTLRHRSPLDEGITADWTTLRENVGCNRPANPDDLHVALMDSTGHRANILADDVRYVGVGAVHDADGGLWVTQIFMDATDHDAEDPYASRSSSTSTGTASPSADAVTSEGIAASRAAFPEADDAEVGVISRNDVFADSLAGAALAGTRGTILFTDPPEVRQGLRADTRDELDRVLPFGARVYLLGGEAAVGGSVDDELRGAGYEVVRLGGDGRYSTAAIIAGAVVAEHGSPDRIAVASGANWPDAVTAGAAAARGGFPVVLTDPDVLPPATAQFLDRYPAAQRMILGGTAAISSSVGAEIDGTRVAGRTRDETALAVARTLFGDVGDRIVVVDGWDEPSWGRALAWAPFAARRGAPQVLVSDAGLSTPVRDWLSQLDAGTTPTFTTGISAQTEDEVRSLLG